RAVADQIQLRPALTKRGEAVDLKLGQRLQYRVEHRRGQRVAFRQFGDVIRQAPPWLIDSGGLLWRHRYIQADADHDARLATGFAAVFDENAGQLGVVDVQVVRPL